MTEYKWLYTIACTHSQITIKLTIYIVKGLYNWLSTDDYTIDYIHSQMTIQMTIYLVKCLCNWLYTYSTDNTIDCIYS